MTIESLPFDQIFHFLLKPFENLWIFMVSTAKIVKMSLRDFRNGRYANKKIEKFTIKRFCHLRAICIIFKTLLWLKFNIRLLFYLYDSSISMLKNASTRVNSAEGNLNSYRLGGCMYTVVEYSCTSLNKCFPPSEIFVSIPSALWQYRSDDDDNY